MPFDATPTITEADVLRRAKARLMDPAKWCKEPYSNGKYPQATCANLAIFDETPNIALQKRASDLLWKATGLPGDNNVPKWNDAPETTHADVIAAFDRAIALAEAGEP